MNSNEGNNKYNFGFDEDDDDNQENQMNNNFYPNEDNNTNNFNNNMNNNNFNNNNNNNFNNNFNNNNDNYNQFGNNQNQFNNNYNFNNQNNQFGINQNNYNMNNNNNFNNMNPNQFNQYNNQNNYPNNNFQYMQQNQKKQEQKPKNPDKEKLKNAYNLFMQGITDCKKYNYEIGLDKFERIKKTIEEVYPKIEKDEEMKKTTDDFLKKVNQYITTTERQIKQKYSYVPAYNYSNELDAKKEVARFLKETELASQERKKKFVNIMNDLKQKPKDSPSYYMNNDRNYNNNINNNTNNNPNNAPKKDETKIITDDLRDKVLSEIVERKPDVKFSDVIGLKEAKEILRQIIIVPNLRPDLFKGLRSPPRGLLLFGPPGTGKTMIAKAVATECKCTFFNISASSLTSKYLGESEKLVRTLFNLAHEMQPSVVFVDEIESILSKRKEDENDAMKRLKTEFLIQFDGVGSGEDLRVLIIGATNRPFDLDPAIVRRLPKRVYVGPFNVEERKGFIKTIITQNKCDIKDEEYKKIAEMCNNYSNSDLKELCREAAYEPLRELNVKSLKKVDELRPIVFDDFVKALKKVKGTLTKKILMELENWNKEFGALS